MNHISAFLIKWVAIFASILFVGVFLPLTVTMNWVQAFILSLIISILGYIGDWFVIPAMNSIVALFLDFAMTLLVVRAGHWIFSGVNISWTFAVLTAILVTVVEIFYHTKVITPQLKNKM